MTMETESLGPEPPKRRRPIFLICTVILLLLLLFSIVFLILALTVFKTKEPQIKLISASLQGVSPKISFPVISLQLNITLNTTLLVHNPNYASFKHGVGQTLLYYRGNQVGEAQLFPGFIPSRGSGILLSKLSLQMDQFADDVTGLIRDILSGQIMLETRTRIPGRLKLLRVIKKHVVASSGCSFVIAFPAMKIQDQKCNTRNKF